MEFGRWIPEVNTLEATNLAKIRWIEVLGLPHHLWTLGFFRAIGGLCGAFIRVDENSSSLVSCKAAKIGVWGGPMERIPQVIALFDRGKKLRVEVHLVALEATKCSSAAVFFPTADFKIQNE